MGSCYLRWARGVVNWETCCSVRCPQRICSVRCPQRIMFDPEGLRWGQRTLQLCAINSHDFTGVRPIFSPSDESAAHWILKYIFPFLSVAFVAAQKMVVKSWLPEGGKLLTF